MKKVIIIGAGIAGMTCGIYLKLNGFDVQICEMHTIPGGECTGWDRKGYHFDGCIHWLMGSKPGNGLHEVWRTTGALDEDVRIINHEIFSSLEEGDRRVNLYTNADKLQEHLLAISPEDKKEIKALCKALRSLGTVGMPLDKPMDMMTMGDGLRFAAANLTKLGMLSRYTRMSMQELAARFSSPLIRRAILAAIPGDYKANAFVMTLSGMHRGDSGVPQGGSRALALRMAKRFEELGGSITYRARIEEILIENNRAVGVRFADGTDARGDYVVSCADGYATLYKMLKNKYTPDALKKLYENPREHFTPTSAIVFMGIDGQVEGPRALNISRGQKVSIGGCETDLFSLLNYSYDGTMAPAGKTVMAAYYNADYDFWNKVHADKEAYKLQKERLLQDAIAGLIKRYPQTEDKIEVTDVVTPMTYVRYCDAWRGAWMSWSPGDEGVPRFITGEVGLDGFLMGGMWTSPPGGLPGAAAGGRFAAHRLCIKEGMEFKTE